VSLRCLAADFPHSLWLVKTILTTYRVPTEYAKIKDTYSPLVNRVNQVIRHRAVYPTEPLPKPLSILTKYTATPEKLLEESKEAIEALVKAGDVKKGKTPIETRMITQLT
jgi:ATP-dependent DNA helicase 2 subunit 2